MITGFGGYGYARNHVDGGYSTPAWAAACVTRLSQGQEYALATRFARRVLGDDANPPKVEFDDWRLERGISLVALASNHTVRAG